MSIRFLKRKRLRQTINRVVVVFVLMSFVTTTAWTQFFDELDEVRDFQNGFVVGIGAMNVAFPRSPWVNSPNLLGSDGYGLALDLHLNALPFLIDFKAFGNTFKSETIAVPVPPDSIALFGGLNLVLGYHLLPHCKYINPYLGAGWQLDHFKTRVPSGATNYGRVNETTSSFFWRFGALIHFGEIYGLHLFYQKTLPHSIKTEGHQLVPNAILFPDRPYSVQMLCVTFTRNLSHSKD